MTVDLWPKTYCSYLWEENRMLFCRLSTTATRFKQDRKVSRKTSSFCSLLGSPEHTATGLGSKERLLLQIHGGPNSRSRSAITETAPPAPLPPPALVTPNCVLQHLFIIDGRHDGYGHNINARLTRRRHESWPTLFPSRRFIGPRH